MDSYFEYEYTWSSLNDYVERFNSRFQYHLTIEPFLFSDDYSNVGMFNQFGLILFFVISPHIPQNKILTEKIDLVRVQVCLEDFLTYDEFEVIVIKYSSRLLKKRMEDKRNAYQQRA